jgi:hypothetical protein
MLPVLFGITVITFTFTELAPGAGFEVHKDHGGNGVAGGQFGKGKGDDRDTEQDRQHLYDAA